MNKNIKEKYISFDFFDTVIHRDCHPEVILYSWSREISNLLKFEISTSEIYDLRKKVELKYKKLDNVEELNYTYFLRKIYEEIRDNKNIILSEEEFLIKAKKLELEIEKKHIYVDEDTVNIIKEEYSNDKKIILISDFYADKELIVEIMKSLDIYKYFSEVFISSEYGVRKSTGNLYKKVIEVLGISPEQLHMTGDNIESDYNIPKSLGITAAHKEYIDNNKIILEKELHKIYDKILFSDPQNKPFNGFLADILYFISKLHMTLVKNGVKKAAFCAREGQLLKVLFDKYQEKFFSNNLIETKYFYVSRRSTLYPSLKNLEEEHFDIIFRQYKTIDLDNFLANLNISDEDINLIASDLEVENTAELKSESNVLVKLKENKLFRELYYREKEKSLIFSEYVKEFVDEDTLHLVDIGWKGTIQDNIQKALPDLKIKGYYLGLILNAYNVKKKEDKFGLLFTDYPRKSKLFNLLSRNYGFYEQIFVADHGPTISYGHYTKIIPILDDEEKHIRVYNFVKKFQEAMIEGFDKLLKEHYNTPFLPYEKERLFMRSSLKRECVFIPKIIRLEDKLKNITAENFGYLKEDINKEVESNLREKLRFIKWIVAKKRDFLWVDYSHDFIPIKPLVNLYCRFVYGLKYIQYSVSGEIDNES